MNINERYKTQMNVVGHLHYFDSMTCGLLKMVKKRVAAASGKCRQEKYLSRNVKKYNNIYKCCIFSMIYELSSLNVKI